MKKISKRLAIAMALGTVIAATPTAASAAGVAEVAATLAKLPAKAPAVNWNKGARSDITAVGIGSANPKGMPLTRKGAIMDAQRNLLEIIKGVQVDAESTMEDLMVTSDVVKSKVNGILKGYQIIDEGANADGSYFVKLRVPLFGEGSIASAAIPEIRKPELAPEPTPVISTSALPAETVKKVRRTVYTGVVVDASSLGLAPTFSPIIYDVNGRAIYGIKNIETSVAINRGMVGYSVTVEAATNGSRAGDNPLVVKAVEVRGGKNSTNPVNVVVSVEDADRILIANEKGGFLQSGSVMFVR